MPTLPKENSKDLSQQDLLNFLHTFKDYSIIVLDPNKNVFTWNEGAAKLYGYSTKEMLGHPIGQLYPDEELLTQQEYYLEQARVHGRVEYDIWIRKKDNSRVHVNSIVVAIYHADGSVKGFTKVARDTTTYKKLEEENALLKESLEEKVRQRTRELEVVNKELEAFSYSVSHDLRTPLRAVIGYATMLKEDYESQLDQEANRIINNIINNTKMMGNLIDDLLTFSKMARLAVVNESIDMKKMVEDCINDLLQNETVSAPLFTIAELPFCNGDRSMLKQVWYNLLSNAIKYSSKKERPVIEIGYLENKNHHVYSVKDNGEGFNMKYANKLFGVFQRLHRHDEFEGTGLGLALAKRIISKHGGDIWADAVLHTGATFYFSIPKKISNG